MERPRGGDGSYLRELEGPVGQQRRHPVGTFGHVTVELGSRLHGVLGHVLVDVLYSTLRDQKHTGEPGLNPPDVTMCSEDGGRTLMTLKTIMSPDEPTSKGLICNRSEYLET